MTGDLSLLSRLALFLALSSFASIAQAQAPDLLLPAPAGARAAAVTLPSSALRANAVTVSQPVVDSLAPGAEVRLALFNDRAPVVTFDRKDDYGSYGHVWVGHVKGEQYSEVYLADVEGSLVIGFRSHGKPFVSMQRDGGSGYVVYEAAPQDDFCGASQSPAAAATSADAEPSLGTIALKSPTETHVDIAAFYTNVARAAAGGTAPIQATILAAFSSANQGHSVSGTQTRLRLVHLEELTYGEAGDLQTHLNNLSGTNDGFMDVVHARRDTFGADLVTLFVNDQGIPGFPNTIGLAWRPGRFSVNKWNPTASVNLLFAHEVGHNLGLCHETANTPSCNNDGTRDMPNVGGGDEDWTEGVIAHNHGIRVVIPGPSIFCNIDCVATTVMFSSLTSDSVNRYSDPDWTYVCNWALCPNESAPLGNSATADTQRVLRDYRSRSANEKQPVFYVSSGGGDGNATYMVPEDDVADVYNQWFPLTEPDAMENADVFIAPGSYSAPLVIDKKSTLNRWNLTTGTAVLGQ